jgi:hypothetical protein
MWKIKKLISIIEDVKEERSFEDGVRYTIDSFINTSCYKQNVLSNLPFSMVKDTFRKYTSSITTIEHYYHLLNQEPHQFFLLFEDIFTFAFLQILVQKQLLKPFGTACFIFHKKHDIESLRHQILRLIQNHYILLPMWELNESFVVFSIHNLEE